MYRSEACCLKQSDIRSLDFAVNRVLMKLFKTANVNVTQDCVNYFNFKMPSSLLLKRTQTFLSKYNINDKSICKLFSSIHAAMQRR